MAVLASVAALTRCRAVGLAVVVGAIAALIAAALTVAPRPAAAQAAGAACPTSLETAPVTVTTPEGVARRFTAELALTVHERACGLMFRTALAPGAAMLFVYPDSGQRAFWMENTLISLDIIFADPDGVVLNVAARAKPRDRTPLPSNGDAQFVLEIPGGLAAALGIGPGSIIASPALLDAAARAR